MPDVHIPKLDEHNDEEPTAPVSAPVSTSHHRSHATLKQELTTYFALEPRTSAKLAETVHMTMGVGPVFFEQAAWDLALATQALAYVDADLAFKLSRAYTLQKDYAELQRSIERLANSRPKT